MLNILNKTVFVVFTAPLSTLEFFRFLLRLNDPCLPMQEHVPYPTKLHGHLQLTTTFVEEAFLYVCIGNNTISRNSRTLDLLGRKTRDFGKHGSLGSAWWNPHELWRNERVLNSFSISSVCHEKTARYSQKVGPCIQLEPVDMPEFCTEPCPVFTRAIKANGSDSRQNIHLYTACMLFEKRASKVTKMPRSNLPLSVRALAYSRIGRPRKRLLHQFTRYALYTGFCF